MQPARDMIVVDALPGGTLDPSVDRLLPLDRQTGSVVGIDATFPFGAEIRTAGARPVSRDIYGPALAEKDTSTSRSPICRVSGSMSSGVEGEELNERDVSSRQAL
jgi:3-polyprenyl-4-hydroxybenzoate decarboxylase